MSNDFYNAGGVPAQGAGLSSATIRAEFLAIAAGFDKLPTVTGNASKAIVVNGSGTGLTTTSGTLTLAGNFATAGASALTLTTTAPTNVTLPTSGTLLSTASVVTPSQGGTGVANNNASTITITGAFALGITISAGTSITLPTSGTLSTLAGAEELTNKTLTASVGKGTWTASGTWTLPAVTLGGAVTLSSTLSATSANTVTLSPSGAGTVTINPATAGTMNNVVIGGSTPLAGSFTTLSATGVIRAMSAAFVAPASGTSLELNYRSGDSTGHITAYDRTGAAYKAISMEGLSIALLASGLTGLTVDSSGNTVLGGTLKVKDGDTSITGSAAAGWIGINGDPAGFGTGPTIIVRGGSYVTPAVEVYHAAAIVSQLTSSAYNLFVPTTIAKSVAAGTYTDYLTLVSTTTPTASNHYYSTLHLSGASLADLKQDTYVYNDFQNGIGGFGYLSGRELKLETGFNLLGARTVALWLDVSQQVYFPSIGTTASAANAFLNSGVSNQLLRSTSLEELKNRIAELSVEESKRVLFEADWFAYTSRLATDDPNRVFVGTGARGVFKLDKRFVHYENDEPSGVQYERFVAPLAVVVKDHDRELEENRAWREKAQRYFDQHGITLQ
jgi:hypothetical protein